MLLALSSYPFSPSFVLSFFFLMIRPPPRSPLFPSTTLFRSRRIVPLHDRHPPRHPRPPAARVHPVERGAARLDRASPARHPRHSERPADDAGPVAPTPRGRPTRAGGDSRLRDQPHASLGSRNVDQGVPRLCAVARYGARVAPPPAGQPRATALAAGAGDPGGLDDAGAAG